MKNFKSIFLLITVFFVLSCYMEENSDDVLGKDNVSNKKEFSENGQTPGETISEQTPDETTPGETTNEQTPDETIPDETIIEWGNDNAVYAVVQPGYAGQAIEDAENGFGAFEPLDIKAVYAVGKGGGAEALRLLLVLNNAGEQEQEAAVAILRGDSRIQYAIKCNDVPFETVNTLHLSASCLTVKVGDTLTVKPEGMLKVYQPTFSFDSLGSIKLANYNLHKQYTSADFPQAKIESVKKYDWSFGTYFYLSLSEPGYFNVIKAIDAFARDPNVLTVGVDGFGFPDVVCFDAWKISDASIADFTGKDQEPYVLDDQGNVITWRIIPNENGEVTIEAIRPGKVTGSYTPSMGYYMGTEYEVTLEINIEP